MRAMTPIDAARPSVSVIIACYNAAAFLRAAVRSALDQTIGDIEVIIVDDVSSDDSLALARDIAASDPRVRVDALKRNCGPAGARNRGLDLATGDWIALLDSDDLYHPDRLRRLIVEGDETGADIVADDLLIFDDQDRTPPETFFAPPRDREPGWIGLRDYLVETVMYGAKPNLGFLKPMFRRAFLQRHRLRYDESLRIAEDDDLIVRALAAGARYFAVVDPTYFYRKHGSSISHRLSSSNIEAMVGAGERLAVSLSGLSRAEHAALERRNRGLRNTRDFTLAIEALKVGALGRALGLVFRRPGLIPLLRMPIAARLRRWLDRPTMAPAHQGTPQACIISRQRLIGATNGSSSYLIDLARTMRAANVEPHLVQPSPTVFGRMPFFRRKREMDVFESHRLRGAIRLGSWFVAVDPRIYAHGARGMIARAARRIGISSDWATERPAPYAVTAPWEKADLLYVARHARPRADRIIVDYAFQVEAIPYAVRPDAPTAIIMHDLFHARADQFSASGHRDSVATVNKQQECELLARADVVLAIQHREAAFVDEWVPTTRSLTVPMAVRPVAWPAVGEDGRLLFVGSNTAPNVTALQWLFEHVWPTVRRVYPEISLDIAGTVAWAFAAGGPEGTRFLGLVDDLAVAYRDAGVVISPLIHGSGLKVKLVEALAYGKAVVATSVTVEGVEAEVDNAIRLANEPADFAAAIVDLAMSAERRMRLATLALDAARRHFSAETCHASFRAWLADERR